MEKHTHKIVSKVTHFNFRPVNYCNASNPAKNEIFQGLRTRRTTVEQAYTCLFKGRLPLLTPDSTISTLDQILEIINITIMFSILFFAFAFDRVFFQPIE